MNWSTSLLLPREFHVAGVHCGVKPDPAKLDLALFVSDRPAAAAGVFTLNRVCGAPVRVSRERVPRNSARAVVVNSGNANACTGEQGLADARRMTELVAESLGCDAADVLVCSTGVIGRFLPMENISAGIGEALSQLGDSSEKLGAAAQAMMTTDTVPKLAMREGEIGGRTVRVTGVAKGAAMIAPNMATMLAVVLTDAALAPAQADAMLRHAVDRSFNCISVEGHTSTSDTVLLLANGAAGVTADGSAELQEMLDDVCRELAQAIVQDAEGAEHFITIDVRGCRSRGEALRIARAIADSPLVKTAIAGADPNWGRIVSAVGYCGVELEEENISLSINGIPLYAAGAPVDFDAAELSKLLKHNRDVLLELALDLGNESARFWTSDLTEEYVRLNADYTT